MSFLHKLLAAAYQPIKCWNDAASSIGRKSSDQLRILLLHDVFPQHFDRLKDLLSWLKSRWQFITPEQFEQMKLGLMPIQGRNLLITFDDGFASNRQVVEQVLDPLSIKALFFIVSEFAGINDINLARAFVSDHICPNSKLGQLPEHINNMTWKDLEFLLKNGHTLGSHTRTHARLSDLAQYNALFSEIISSADVIENKLGIGIKHFAYTFGNIGSFSPEALKMARQRYQFVHTGMRGDNCSSPLWAIRRDSASLETSFSLVGSFLEGGADILYQRHLLTYESWGDNVG